MDLANRTAAGHTALMGQPVDDYDDHPHRRDRRFVLLTVIVVLAIFLLLPVALAVLFILALGFSNM
jgi:hypothetical protein